jgi:hypothetical protein
MENFYKTKKIKTRYPLIKLCELSKFTLDIGKINKSKITIIKNQEYCEEDYFIWGVIFLT